MGSCEQMARDLWDNVLLACFATGLSVGCWLSFLLTWLEMRKR